MQIDATPLTGVRSRECTSLVMGFPGSAAVLKVLLHPSK